MARKLVSRVSRNAPFLLSKQAHARSPSWANIHPPFFCFDGYDLTLSLSGKKIIGETRTKPTFLSIFAQQTGPRMKSSGANFHPPFFALMGMI
jgi:hypothetical protein